MGSIQGPKSSKLLFGFLLLLWISFPECIRILAALTESGDDSWDHILGCWPIRAQFPGCWPALGPATLDLWHEASDFAGRPLLGPFPSPMSRVLKKVS